MKKHFVQSLWIIAITSIIISCSETKVPDAMSHFNHGNQLFREHSFGMALSEYKAAIAIDDTQPAYYYNLGLTYYTIRQYESAVEAYQKAIDLNPKLTDSWYNLSLALYKLGKADEATIAHETYLKLSKTPNQKME